MAKATYDDKSIATNLLIDLKHLKALFNTFSQETSNESLYSEIDSLYEEISTMQRNLYDLMKKQGWYKMQAEEKTKISKAYTKLSNTVSKMK